ncbi:cyclin-like protein, partial [Cantharellus anzutake]
SQWLFKGEHVGKTPSVALDGKSVSDELVLRNQGIEFLSRVSLQLKLTVPVISTAAVYFHRFYMRYSINGHIIYDTAGACIFLACKTEETGRKLRDVAIVCHAKASGLPPTTDEQDPNVTKWMKRITQYEELLLEALCFDMTVEHPHTALLTAAKVLHPSEELLAYSWSIINDTYRTPLCVLYSHNVIACACYLLAHYWMD